MDYPQTTEEVWPAYSAGRRVLLSFTPGFALASVQPGAAVRTAAMVGAVRGGYTVGDRGFEVIADFGGNMAGPPAIFADAGARWMFAPIREHDGDHDHVMSIYLGPEVVAGTLVTLPPRAPGAASYGTTAAQLMVGGSIDVVAAYSPRMSLDLSAGNLRYVPTRQGALLLAGATLGFSLRF